MPRPTHLAPTLAEEEALRAQGYSLIAGVDEAGRGPLAGPVVAAAVILPFPLGAEWLHLVRDSKRLSPAQREDLFPLICEAACAWAVGQAGPEEVDHLGIVGATRRAMLRAVSSLRPRPHCLLIDAVPLPEAGLPFRALVKGDARCLSIATASILAKVYRDRLMEEVDREYPGYGFARHKGYPTRSHLEALRRLGPCPLHRTSYRPVRALLRRG